MTVAEKAQRDWLCETLTPDGLRRSARSSCQKRVKAFHGARENALDVRPIRQNAAGVERASRGIVLLRSSMADGKDR